MIQQTPMIAIRSVFSLRMLGRLLFTVALLSICSGSIAADFSHQFGMATPGEAAFIVGFDTKEPCINLRNGLRIKQEAKHGPLDSRGVKTVFGIRGDGGATLLFDVNNLGVPDVGWGSGIMLRLEFTDAKQRGLTVALQRLIHGTTVLMVDETTYGQDQHQVQQWPVGGPLIAAIPTGLRVLRQEDRMEVGALMNGQWLDVVELVSPTDDIYPIGVWVGTGGATADIDMTLKKLDVTGVVLPTDSGTPLAGLSLWTILQAVMVGTVMLSGWLLWRQPRAL